ncbi:transglutaminase family protein [Enterococcus sp. BWB1-3]|uniref:transglutaminase domain-containing protein n=1 Tax=unclassified Enterococcus TaxID=2608891 RepID=UPI0019243F00|nr:MULTISPECIES: transglutaminase domain-containing protein [unclassified Enterococcus]MBL1229498.1 transglutaminase family protein [Enterococcus sp. BWB1-3]MCB5950811.1 transglutaminase domain-containing protein [Enterococcus sp. BWT-B8]
MEKEYYILEPSLASAATKQENIEMWLKAKETDFYKAQIEQERDYCFWCYITETAKQTSLESHTSMAYTLNDPQTLNVAAKTNFILNKDEVLYIHTLSVVRDGQVIDKLDDINVKVLDHIQEGNNGSFSDQKNITILIRDLHLNDVFIIETTIKCKYSEDSLRNQFFRYSYSYPGPYWAYSEYRFQLKNESGQALEGNYHYFRDESGKIIEKEKVVIADQGTFVIEEKLFNGKEIKEGEIEPFIDFSTQKNFTEITEVLAELYQKFYQADVNTFAAELIKELELLPSLENKIRYAIDFVQKQIYYLYNASEMDGHEPQAADSTFKTKQGDCKAKTVLLKVLLDYLGIHSEIVLVNYERDIFLPVYTPSPFIFNHAILKIYYEDKIYFVDATVENDQGVLGKRRKDSFMYYLEIKAGTELQKQMPFQEQPPVIEEIITCNVKEDAADFSLKGTLRGRVANTTRDMFKNQTNKDIIKTFNGSIYNNMALHNKYEAEEIDKYFSDTSIQIVNDNKEQNEIQVLYKARISSPYLKEGNKRFLHYWDRTYFVDDGAKNFHHRDFPFWIDRNSVKMEIHLTTDCAIDQQEKFTRQECDIQSVWLQHRTTKKISEHGVSCYLEYHPYRNLAISGKELEEYIKVNDQIRNSNLGVGIDIVEDTFFKKISRLFKGK